MFRAVNIDPNQKVTDIDLDNMGTYPRAAFDVSLRDVIGPANFYSGFGVTETGGGVVKVSTGRVYFSGVGYINDSAGGTDLNMLEYAPVTLERFCAITVGKENVADNVIPTVFITNTQTRDTTSRNSSRTRLRWAPIGVIAGVPSADPSYPQIPPDVVAVAYVRMTSAGILDIITNFDQRIPDLRGLDLRLNSMESWRETTGDVLDTLTSSLANLQRRMNTLATWDFVKMLASDIADVRETLDIEPAASVYDADDFIDEEESDTAHASYDAKIEEGICFNAANERNVQLATLISPAPDVTRFADKMMPSWSEVVGLKNIAHSGELSLSQYEVKTTTYKIFPLARTRIRVGRIYVPGKGVTKYRSVLDQQTWRAYAGVYKLVGEVETDRPKKIDIHAEGVVRYLGEAQRRKHVFKDHWKITAYGKFAHTTSSFMAVQTAQSFLADRDGWLTAIDLAITRRGVTGDIQVLLSELPSGGEPDPEEAIAATTVLFANIKTFKDAKSDSSWTKASFASPIYIKKGQRYAIHTITSGNHYVAVSTGNALPGGAFFADGVNTGFEIKESSRDMLFRLRFARFAKTRVDVQMSPLQLDGGIAAIDLLAESYVPSGTSLVHLVQIGAKWVDLESFTDDYNPLDALPVLLNYKVAFIGTADLMPVLGVGPKSRVITHRPKTAFRHISKARLSPTAANSVEVDIDSVGFVEADHNLTIRLRPGPNFTTVLSPSVQQDRASPGVPGMRRRHCKFTGLGGITQWKIDITGTTNTPIDQFRVDRRYDAGFA